MQWLIFFRFSDVKVAKLHLEQLQYLTNFDAIEIKISNFQFNTIVGDKKSNFAKNFDVLLFVCLYVEIIEKRIPSPVKYDIGCQYLHILSKEEEGRSFKIKDTTKLATTKGQHF